jgi:hypothetical protein
MSHISINPSQIESKEIFPLPLVAMEYFWLWDDTPSHPKRFRIVIELSGIVNVLRLQQSLELAIVRHPLLISVIESRGAQKQWAIPSEPKLGWQWNGSPWQESPFPDEWDLTTEGGLRIWGSQHHDTAEISFETHHAVSDALGLRQFLRDFFVAYDELTKDPACSPKLPPTAYDRLKDRGHFFRPTPTADSRSTTTWEKIVGAYHFHFRGPIPIAASKGSGSSRDGRGRHYYFRHTFDRKQTERIEQRQAEQALQIFGTNPHSNDLSNERPSLVDSLSTFNDAAIVHMLQVLAVWNREQGSASANQRLRIMVPTDLRAPRDSRLSATNRLGFGFVVAATKDCSDFSTLLRSVQLQTLSIRKYRLGLDFVEIFGLLAKYPKMAEWLIRRKRCLATGVLTNMGDSFGRFRKHFDSVEGRFRVGDVFVESFAGYPPLRPKTHVGMGMSRCAGRLTMGLIIDSQRFSREQAAQLSHRWVQKWLDSIACNE